MSRERRYPLRMSSPDWLELQTPWKRLTIERILSGSHEREDVLEEWKKHYDRLNCVEDAGGVCEFDEKIESVDAVSVLENKGNNGDGMGSDLLKECVVGVKGKERNAAGEVLLKCDSIGGDKLKEKSEGERWEKGKDNYVGSSSAGFSDTADLKEYIMISSDSEREMSPIYEDLEEEYWTRKVNDVKKFCSNVMQIPAKVIYNCGLAGMSQIVLYDVDNGCPYYCDVKKRRKKKETYLYGEWFDYARAADLKEGDKVHFVIRYPPVEDIMVTVERSGGR